MQIKMAAAGRSRLLRMLLRGKHITPCVSSTLRAYSKMNARSGRVNINGVSLYYDDHGDVAAPVVLCVPGVLGSSMSDFKPQFEGLAKRCRVVSFHLRGYGKSIPPDRDYPIDYFERDANDLAKGMEKLGIDRYNVLGWSDGGMAGIVLAAVNSDKVSNLVVWGSNCFLTEEDLDMLEKIRDIKDWSESMRKSLEGVYGAERLQQIWSLYLSSFANFMKLNGGEICSRFLPQIKCPTLVVHGLKDSLVPLSHAKYIKNNIPEAKIIIFENGKHNLHLRYAEEFNTIVLKDVLHLE